MSDSVSEFVGTAEIVAARFDKQHDADVVRLKIEALGYDSRERSFISDAKKCSFTCDGIGDHAAAAAAQGVVSASVVGAALGTVAVVLGFDGRVFLGPIGLLTGAAIGEMTGVLLGLGLSSNQAVACEDAVSEGSLVMKVQARAGGSAAVRAAIGDHRIKSGYDNYFSSTASQIAVEAK